MEIQRLDGEASHSIDKLPRSGTSPLPFQHCSENFFLKSAHKRERNILEDAIHQSKRRKISSASPSSFEHANGYNDVILEATNNANSHTCESFSAIGLSSAQSSEQNEPNRLLSNGTEKLVEQTLANLEPHIARLVYESLKSSIEKIHKTNLEFTSNHQASLQKVGDEHISKVDREFNSSFTIGNLANSSPAKIGLRDKPDNSSPESNSVADRDTPHPDSNQPTQLTNLESSESFDLIDQHASDVFNSQTSIPLCLMSGEGGNTPTSFNTQPIMREKDDQVYHTTASSGVNYSFVNGNHLNRSSYDDPFDRRVTTGNPLTSSSLQSTPIWPQNLSKVQTLNTSPQGHHKTGQGDTGNDNYRYDNQQVDTDEQVEAISLVIPRSSPINCETGQRRNEFQQMSEDRMRRRRSKVTDVQTPHRFQTNFMSNNSKPSIFETLDTKPFPISKNEKFDGNLERLVHLQYLLSCSRQSYMETSHVLPGSDKLGQISTTDEMNFNPPQLVGTTKSMNDLEFKHDLSTMKFPNWIGEPVNPNMDVWLNHSTDPYMTFQSIFAKAFRKLMQTPKYNMSMLVENRTQRNPTNSLHNYGWLQNKSQFDFKRPSMYSTFSKLNLKAKVAEELTGMVDTNQLRRQTFGRRSDKRTLDNSVGNFSRFNPVEELEATCTEGGMRLTTTLTPVHLRKAKLMFFYTRYPNSTLIKMYFPDVKFYKNNTAQLVKWFSNFREFYYIQMEKYARIGISEGVRSADAIHVTTDSELYRALNLHYNRNQQLVIPDHFRVVAEATLKEFFNALICGKDSEQSWKKPIYKIIARMDQSVPEFFKNLNWMEQLADG